MSIFRDDPPFFSGKNATKLVFLPTKDYTLDASGCGPRGVAGCLGHVGHVVARLLKRLRGLMGWYINLQ